MLISQKQKVSLSRLIRMLGLSVVVLFVGIRCVSGNDNTAVTAQQFEEYFLERVPVSGSVLVGVQYAESQMTTPKLLWVYLPILTDEHLCVSLHSDDGRYSATSEYSLRGRAVGPQMLSFPTKKENELARYGTGRISALAVIGGGCKAPESSGNVRVYLPVGWSEPTSFKVSVLINASDADVQLFNSADHSYSSCSLLSNESKVAYDTQCKLTLGSVAQSWKGYVVRNIFQSFLPQIPLNIGSK
jgi:hypothetical protein